MTAFVQMATSNSSVYNEVTDQTPPSTVLSASEQTALQELETQGPVLQNQVQQLNAQEVQEVFSYLKHVDRGLSSTQSATVYKILYTRALTSGTPESFPYTYGFIYMLSNAQLQTLIDNKELPESILTSHNIASYLSPQTSTQ